MISFTHAIDSVGLSMSPKIAKPLATTEGPEPFAKLAEDLDEIHDTNWWHHGSNSKNYWHIEKNLKK